MEMKSLHKLLIHELKDLYSAENQIIKAMPKMIKAASSAELKESFEMHLAQTKKQVERLNRIARKMEEKEFKGQKCKGMEGVIEEGNEVIKEGGEPAVVDAALIGAAQKVEHYEIATYGTARAHARQLGLADVVNLLQETLDEEGQTNKMLTRLALKKINIEAERESSMDGTNGHGRSGGPRKSARGAMPRATSKAGGSRTGSTRSTSRTRRSSPNGDTGSMGPLDGGM